MNVDYDKSDLTMIETLRARRTSAQGQDESA
ncbi:hypothetical protein BDZ31_001353 [Conexibacter arvalis]|uniref:Uncharacterized protein n=1 Tax=Conexibacter arvalis TaxID=912552 RepID=A0A840ICV8_9ACTN|nr:hypothetical protein [Conexibacter arvalis]